MVPIKGIREFGSDTLSTVGVSISFLLCKESSRGTVHFAKDG